MTSQSRRELAAEPWQSTALRTGTIALAIGACVGVSSGRLSVVLPTSLIALWFTLGGHFVEVLFRNRLRYGIGTGPFVQVFARLACWFVGGSALYAGAGATRAILTGRGFPSWPWWTGGAFFVGLELLVHLWLRSHGQPSFYDGRG